MNTHDKGQVSILIVEAKDKSHFLGICYDLAIVLEGDDEDTLVQDMIEAAKGYVQTVRENKMPIELLNKSEMLPSEYKQLYEEFIDRIATKKAPKKLPKKYEDAFQTGRARLTLACA